jgi:hypothetical protein
MSGPPDKSVRQLTGKRALVALGAAIGVAVFVGLLVAASSFLVAFFGGAGAALTTMIVGGTALQFWKGSEVSSAQLPGGAGVGFEAAQEGMADINKRLDNQMTRSTSACTTLRRPCSRKSAPGTTERSSLFHPEVSPEAHQPCHAIPSGVTTAPGRPRSATRSSSGRMRSGADGSIGPCASSTR